MLRRRLSVAAVVMIGVGFVTTGTAYSHETEKTGLQDYTPCEEIAGEVVEIPLDTVLEGEAGSFQVITERAVSEALRDNIINVSFTGKNNGSVHPGSNLIVGSGDDQVVLEDVEAEAGKVTKVDKALKLDSTLKVSVEFGEDEVFSGGGVLALEFTCGDEEPAPTAPPVEQAEFANCESAPSFELPIEKHMSGEPGEKYVLAEFDVDDAFIGNEAMLKLTGENNSSVRAGSNLIFTSGDSEVVLEDVEAEAGKITEATETLVLADTVEVSVQLGEEGAFSGGGTLLLDIVCTEVEEKVEEPAPTTTVPPTTEAPAEPVETVELAATGSDSTILSLLGTLLVLSGGVLMMGARLSKRII